MSSLTQRYVAVTVQCGIPQENEIVYNIHFTNNTTGVVWDVSYRFSQLSTLENDISSNSDKMKEIPFPQIDEIIMKRLAGKANFNGKLQEMSRYKGMIEDWIQNLINRCHLMPFILYELVEDWFCLPDGPVSDWKPGRILSPTEHMKLSQNNKQETEVTTSLQDPFALSSLSVSSSTTNTTTTTNANAPKRKGILKILFTKFTNSVNDFNNPPVETKSSQTPEVFLLKVHVQRGQKGKNGKIEYDIHITLAWKQPSTIDKHKR